jgi:hypothetical protein
LSAQFFQPKPFAGYRFFSRSLLKSPGFLLVIALSVVLLATTGFVFFHFWARVSSSRAIVLFGLFYLGGQMVRTVQRHRRIHELYLTGQISDAKTDPAMLAVLDVAEQSMIDGLWYGLFTTLACVALLGHFLERLH